jgi:hypothetical protein
MAATALAPSELDSNVVECDQASCAAAVSHASLCDCRCGGEGHGHAHRAGIAAAARSLRARTTNGFTSAMLAALDADEPF